MFVRISCVVLCLLLLGSTNLRAQSSAAELNESAWKMIEKGEAARAAKLFAEALALQPDDPVLLFGAGVSAHLQGRVSDAKSKLQRTLEVNPRFTPASLLLGEIVYREGDLDKAIKMYDTALAFAPGQPQLTARLQQWRKEADVHGTFIERRQDRFRVMFEGRTDASLGARTTDALTTAFWRIGKQLGAYPSNSIHVILYTQKQFRDITRAPEWAGGAYDGRIRIPVAGAERSSSLFGKVLAHELTHAMVTSIAPRGVPAWLQEGLAQHFDGSDVQAARRRLQPLQQHIPLDQLEGSFSGLTPAGAVVAYDESLVAVNAIMERSTVSWTQLLSALADSNRPGETLRWFGISYSDLEAAFKR